MASEALHILQRAVLEGPGVLAVWFREGFAMAGSDCLLTTGPERNAFGRQDGGDKKSLISPPTC